MKAKILVVEDETPLALMMAFLLSRVGYDVTTARTGQEGMDLATTTKFDLILLDVDLNGFEICRELKQRWISHRTPIIFLSGNALEERRAKASELGAADFIAKPFTADGFLERVEFYISSAQADGTTTATKGAA